MKQLIVMGRLWAMMVKEFIHIRRDRVTIGMLITIPLIQLVLFGYAINVNPHQLPTAVVSADHSNFTRRFLTALQNTDYFHITVPNATEQQANQLLKTAKVQFVINIPPGFTRKLIHGERPDILVTADATDPVSTSAALRALQVLPDTVFDNEISRGLGYLKSTPAPFQVIVHAKYNPESITQYNIVPGLMGVILTMTLIMITALSITKERETGTFESLLSMPFRPLEVMVGKVIPYVMVGYVQQIIILLAAYYLFAVPVAGSVWLLLVVTLPFILANLFVGLTFSTLANNQLQAIQLTFFFFLPSILLSGFMFPFYGMPTWAQWLGECLPLTHFVRIVRGIMLKSNGFAAIWSDIWPLLIFIIAAGGICLLRFRQTLD